MPEEQTKTKITILPSEKIVAEATKTYVVIDDKGRSITLKRPGILDQFDLVQVLGDAASNQVYRVMCIPLLYVAAIDGVPVAKASTNLELRALISQLESHGFAAIKDGIDQYFSSSEKGGDEAAAKK